MNWIVWDTKNKQIVALGPYAYCKRIEEQRNEDHQTTQYVVREYIENGRSEFGPED